MNKFIVFSASLNFQRNSTQSGEKKNTKLLKKKKSSILMIGGK